MCLFLITENFQFIFHVTQSLSWTYKQMKHSFTSSLFIFDTLVISVTVMLHSILLMVFQSSSHKVSLFIYKDSGCSIQPFFLWKLYAILYKLISLALYQPSNKWFPSIARAIKILFALSPIPLSWFKSPGNSLPIC